MGWCSGTDIYEPVAKEILYAPINNRQKEILLTTLISALHSHDWDCEELVTSMPIELKVFKALGIWADEEEIFDE